MSADSPASHLPMTLNLWPIVVLAVIVLRQYGDSKGQNSSFKFDHAWLQFLNHSLKQNGST